MAAQPAGPVISLTAENRRIWKAREILRLGQLPVDSDDPARTEACITSLNDKVTDLPADEDFVVSEEEDEILREIRRCEGQG